MLLLSDGRPILACQCVADNRPGQRAHLHDHCFAEPAPTRLNAHRARPQPDGRRNRPWPPHRRPQRARPGLPLAAPPSCAADWRPDWLRAAESRPRPPVREARHFWRAMQRWRPRWSATSQVQAPQSADSPRGRPPASACASSTESAKAMPAAHKCTGTTTLDSNFAIPWVLLRCRNYSTSAASASARVPRSPLTQ